MIVRDYCRIKSNIIAKGFLRGFFWYYWASFVHATVGVNYLPPFNYPREKSFFDSSNVVSVTLATAPLGLFSSNSFVLE